MLRLRDRPTPIGMWLHRQDDDDGDKPHCPDAKLNRRLMHPKCTSHLCRLIANQPRCPRSDDLTPFCPPSPTTPQVVQPPEAWPLAPGGTSESRLPAG